MIHWLKDVDWIELSEDPEEDPLAQSARTALVTLYNFERIGDYTKSQPTGPSAGRIYRKNLNWAGDLENWFIYVVIDAPDGNGQLHVPYRVVIHEI